MPKLRLYAHNHRPSGDRAQVAPLPTGYGERTRVRFTRKGLKLIRRSDLENLCWGLLQRDKDTHPLFLEDQRPLSPQP